MEYFSLAIALVGIMYSVLLIIVVALIIEDIVLSPLTKFGFTIFVIFVPLIGPIIVYFKATKWAKNYKSGDYPGNTTIFGDGSGSSGDDGGTGE